MEDTLEFCAEESFQINEDTVIFNGRCPWDLSDRSIIPTYHGRIVRIDGNLWTIRGVEAFAKLPGPSIGESIGLVVTPYEYLLGDDK